MIETGRLRHDDLAPWTELWRGYNIFYKRTLSEAQLAETWRRLMADQAIHGLGARLDGRLVGIAHYLFHASTSAADVCYLQDLFVSDTVRGQGAGRRLIEAVAEAARAKGCPRYYWLTAVDNTTARRLYDQVARHNGFIRYDYPIT